MRSEWALFWAEFAGTALLVAAGVSLVILDFGSGSPVAAAIPSEAARRALTGFGFGCVGALIAISPLGKASGAHINPVVTLAFWLNGTMRGRYAVGYVAAQLAGAVAGALPLLAWGPIGASVAYGATVPGAGVGAWTALAGETATTAALVVGVFVFVGHARLRRFTPLLFPALYALMVWAEAPISGTSTNPARTLGPAVVSGVWRAFWVYLAGPVAGTLLAFSSHRLTWLRKFEVEVSKLYHFTHDPHGVLCRDRRRAPGSGGG
ncbi:MAG TPA: aquaporin [Thermoanaerobaculaceae bacterium]|nr:aquaporin [Thermoanaerobaculaceae bacterium]